jgi:chitodextrinase
MMNKMKTFVAVVFSSILFTLFLAPASAIADTQLNVPLEIQEHSNWCWATSSQAVLSYYGKSVTQCSIASYTFYPWDPPACCGNSTFYWSDTCNSGNTLSGDSNVLAWQNVNSASDYPLSQSAVVTEIRSGQPFIMSWQWTSGSGHELVGYGYDQNGLYLDYMDPWPGHGYTKSLYSYVYSASDHTWVGTLRTIVVGAPTDVSAVAGNAQAAISFTPPTYNSDGTITYTVASNPGNITATGASSPITVTGLTNGTAYTFTVTATNSLGTGLPSSPSNSVTPCTVPGSPTGVSAVAGLAQATVSFTAPASNGGSTITSYTVTSNPGNITATGASSPITMTGLTGGTAYTFTVTARNAAGTGPASSPSISVTPTFTVPEAPTSVSASAGNTQATVSFYCPNYFPYNGGSPITRYTVTSNPGNFTVTGTASPITVTGLTNGTAYTFTVTATNAAGTGPASSQSNSVTPCMVPGAPTGVSASAGIAQATVSFSAPAYNGGSPITSYRVISNPGNNTATGAASSITVTGLTGGTAYTFTVTATNAAGTSPASSPSNSVTPTFTVPGAPTGVSATAGNAQATVSFTASASNGSPITLYTVLSNPGNNTATGAASPIIATGLINGTAYTFTVTATNAAGTSPASSPSNSITPALSYGQAVPALGTWGFLATVGGLALFFGFRRKRI